MLLRVAFAPNWRTFMGTGVKGASGAQERYSSTRPCSPPTHLTPVMEVKPPGIKQGAPVRKRPFHPLSVGTHHFFGSEDLVSAVDIPILFLSLYPETCLFLMNPSSTT